jgi:hypothetical protein
LTHAEHRAFDHLVAVNRIGDGLTHAKVRKGSFAMVHCRDDIRGRKTLDDLELRVALQLDGVLWAHRGADDVHVFGP